MTLFYFKASLSESPLKDEEAKSAKDFYLFNPTYFFVEFNSCETVCVMSAASLLSPALTLLKNTFLSST